MSEQYWVFANGEMKFITYEGGLHSEYFNGGICDYIEKSFPELENTDYEFGELNSFKDYRITDTIIKDISQVVEEQKVELINGKLIPVDEPMEVEEIMITTARTMGELGTLHTGKIYFHNEDNGDIYDPTEHKDADWDGHNVVYKMKNLKYIKDVEHLGETYPLYRKKEFKFKVRTQKKDIVKREQEILNKIDVSVEDAKALFGK